MKEWEFSPQTKWKRTLFSTHCLFIWAERERVCVDETVPLQFSLHNLFIHSHSSDTCTHLRKLELSPDILTSEKEISGSCFRFSFLLCVPVKRLQERSKYNWMSNYLHSELWVLWRIDFFTLNYLASLVQLSEMYNLYVDQWIAFEERSESVSSSYSLTRRKHIDWHLNLLSHLSMHAG